jgi:iron complex outermembrane receptor protein
LSSWTQLHYSRGEDDDTSSLPLLQIDYHTHLESISEELRWTSRTADSKTWLLGVQASLDRDREHRIASLAGLFGNLFDSATLHYAQSVRSAAVFGQLEQRLADRTRLTLAARYTQDELQFNGGAMAGPGPFVPGFVAQVFPGLPSTVNLDRSFHDLSGRIAINVQPNESLLVYGSLSKGYKPGGIFGGFGLAREAFTPYAPERLYAAEVGLRWQAFQSVLTGTASIFRYNYQDIQAQTLIQAATGSIPLLANVGDARVAGAEFSARWQMTQHLKLDVSAGLLETELRDSVLVLDSLQRTLNLKGHELPQAPRWSARTAIRYVPAIALDGWILALQADAFFRGPYWNDIPNQVHLRQSRPVSLYGASIELGSSNDRWALQLWGRNLANDRYLTHGNSSGIGNDLLMYSEGRSYGLSVNCHWK